MLGKFIPASSFNSRLQTVDFSFKVREDQVDPHLHHTVHSCTLLSSVCFPVPNQGRRFSAYQMILFIHRAERDTEMFSLHHQEN